MEGLAFIALLVAITALGKVKRLERILRENHIRPAGAGDLGNQLRSMVGQALTIDLTDGTSTVCKILDADEEWAHVLRNEGKKTQRELLVRLSDVKQISG